MFGRKRRIEKRKLTYEKLAADLTAKMERCDNPDLIDKLGEVFDAVNAMSVAIVDLNSAQDKKVKFKLVQILSINDKTYIDVKERFEKDCSEVINIVSGGKSGYNLTFAEKRKRSQRLEKEARDAKLEEALENVKVFGEQILELEKKIDECNLKIKREKDENKAVLILRERKNIEREQRQKVALKQQNDRIIMLAQNEKYIEEQTKINEGFDIRRVAATARQMERLQAEQAINDRMYDKIMEMTDKSMGVSNKISDAELRELREVKAEVTRQQKEQVFERSEQVLSELQEEYEDEIIIDEVN